jgi:hypothetical protein
LSAISAKPGGVVFQQQTVEHHINLCLINNKGTRT